MIWVTTGNQNKKMASSMKEKKCIWNQTWFICHSCVIWQFKKYFSNQKLNNLTFFPEHFLSSLFRLTIFEKNWQVEGYQLGSHQNRQPKLLTANQTTFTFKSDKKANI